MTDDEIAERLRQSLSDHAATVSAPPDAWERFRQPAGHSISTLPRLSRQVRWLPVSAVAVALGVAAVALFAVLRSPPARTSKLTLLAPPTSYPTPPTSPATTAAVSGAPTTTPGASAVPAAGSVPAGFVPVSVTFVSERTGWVMGDAPCATPPCTSILRTSDGGSSWVGIPAPPTPLTRSGGGSTGVRKVRFANLNDGWAFGSELWTTHDAGGHWHKSVLPGQTPDTPIMDLEAAGGVVHAAYVAVNPDASIMIVTAPVSTDNWTISPTRVPIGAGPVPTAQIVLHGRTGWLLENDRTVIAGARFTNDRWLPWQPPCLTAGGPAALAASSATDLVAACFEGVWTSASPTERVYLSNDGGTTFHATKGQPTSGSQGYNMASPSPKTIVIGADDTSTGPGAALLRASFDGGATWGPVAKSLPLGYWAELGFTSATQGVALGSGGSSATPEGALLMTTDGGHSWHVVAFRRA